MATTQLRVRIDSELKERSDVLLRSLGLDATAFVSMALAQLVNRRGLPFAVAESDEAYFASEYGLGGAAADRAGRRLRREATAARRRNLLRAVKSADDLLP